ncbi:MAG: hypothetical protein ACJ8BC_04630 [Gemmatimonadales bacterium]
MQRRSAVALIALIAIAAPLRAQTTVQRAADVLNRPQPNPVTETRRVTSTTVIVPQREVVVVERVHGRRYGWWKHSQYRVITVYYDGSRFYRRPFDRRALQKVVVYERGGRYYIDDDRWKRDRSRQWGHDDKWRGGDDRRDHDGWDEKRRDDDKWKGDDKRKDDHDWKDENKRKDEDKRKEDDKRKGDDKDSKGNNGHHYGQDPDNHKDKWE